MGQKFCQNHSISHGFQDTSIFVFCNFCEKFENSKWPSFLVRQNFWKLCLLPFKDTLWVKNFVEISVSHGFQDTGIFVFCICISC